MELALKLEYKQQNTHSCFIVVFCFIFIPVKPEERSHRKN